MITIVAHLVIKDRLAVEHTLRTAIKHFFTVLIITLFIVLDPLHSIKTMRNKCLMC